MGGALQGAAVEGTTRGEIDVEDRTDRDRDLSVRGARPRGLHRQEVVGARSLGSGAIALGADRRAPPAANGRGGRAGGLGRPPRRLPSVSP